MQEERGENEKNKFEMKEVEAKTDIGEDIIEECLCASPNKCDSKCINIKSKEREIIVNNRCFCASSKDCDLYCINAKNREAEPVDTGLNINFKVDTEKKNDETIMEVTKKKEEY